MGFVEIIIIVILAAECIITCQILSNLYYANKEVHRNRAPYNPPCVLIVPCKGLDEAFDDNIESFFLQDYQPYHLWFVVQDRQDAAYERLLALKARLSGRSQAGTVKILVSGQTTSASQKLHNLLFAYHQIPEDIEMLAFADSDACAGSYWLSDLLNPLQREKNGATSGYRCFIPQKKNLATLTLSALNAKICQFLGKSRLNLAWGGSMGISVKKFREFEIDKIWSKSLSDDLSLSVAVRKHRQKMVFVPKCMTAGFETTTWSDLWEFARRQFTITRVYTPIAWVFALVSSFISGFGAFAALAAGIVFTTTQNPNAHIYYWLAAILFSFQASRMLIRQQILNILLPQYKSELKLVRILDMFFFWVYSMFFFIIVVSTTFGRTITWRNIRYRMSGPMDIQIIEP